MKKISLITLCCLSVYSLVGMKRSHSGNDETRRVVRRIEVASPVQLQESLVSAAQQGDCDRVRQLLAQGAQGNIPNNKGKFALHKAIRYQNNDVIALLINHGADINVRDNFGETALFDALRAQDSDLVAVLLFFNPDLSLANRFNDTALHIAVSSREAEGCRDNDEQEPIESKSFENVLLLLNHAFSRLNAQQFNAFLNSKDSNGLTALTRAVRHNFLSVALLLVNFRASNVITDDRDNDNENTSLIYAVNDNNIPMVALLLAKRAEINAVEESQDSALMIAAREGFQSMVEFLLTQGADSTLLNEEGKTAASLAEENGHVQLAEILRQYAHNQQ